MKKSSFTLISIIFLIINLSCSNSRIPYEVIENFSVTNLGQKLFFDPILSRDNTISCSSCHSINNGFAENKKFSTGIDNIITKRNSMPLFNLNEQALFFWDGRVDSLEKLIFHPINDSTEMDIKTDALIKKLKSNKEYSKMFEAIFSTKKITKKNISISITAFLESQISKPPIVSLINNYNDSYKPEDQFYSTLIPGISDNVIKAISICEKCHNGETYGGLHMKKNGLELRNNDLGKYNITLDSADIGSFKAPSLFNINITSPYMHDGRFGTLLEVLNYYNDSLIYAKNLSTELLDENNKPIQFNFTEDDKINFLKIMDLFTDSVYIQNLKKMND